MYKLYSVRSTLYSVQCIYINNSPYNRLYFPIGQSRLLTQNGITKIEIKL